jgi:outer membrane protein OmpA-like peptidoglycan-associated protein/Tol biopolymer transport system component
MKKSFVIAVLCLVVETAGAQESNFDRYYREATEAYKFAHRKQAVELFKKAVAENPSHAMANLMAGKSMLLTIHKPEALPYFKKAYGLDYTVDEDILFLIGQGYHYNEQFDSALWYYEKFSSVLMRSLQYNRMKKLDEVNWKIFECRNGQLFKANPRSVTITNLDSAVNSTWPDYAPTISADESVLIFTSRRPESNANEELAEDQEYYEEILISKRVNGQWTKATQIQELNSDYHDASVSLSPNGKQMFVYSDENGGDIYETVLLLNGQWTEPKRMNGFINSPYMESSVSVSSDESKLFFVSDRPDGYGGTDIYMSTKNKRGEWSEAVNLGNTINTPRDEDDVFVSANGKHIYFSSNGHAGMGDLDVYRAEYDSAKSQWGEPMNLGYPINSVENDFYFVMTGDEKAAYISSFRKDSRGEQDIYRVDLTNWQPLTREALVKKETDAIHEQVQAAVAKPEPKPAASAPTELTIAFTDALGNSIDVPVEATTTMGEKLRSQKTAQGEVVYTFNEGGKYRLRAVTPKAQNAVVAAPGTPLQVGEPAAANSMFFTFYCGVSKTEPLNAGLLELVSTALKENATYTVAITGHADNTGTSEANTELSRKRAEAIKRRLQAAGIEANRIAIISAGATQPVETNGSATGRRLNRRVVVEVVRK